MIRKPIKIRSKAIRESARDQACLLRLEGICNGDWQTTVLHHLQGFGGCTGGKEHDYNAIFVCSSCHSALHGEIPYLIDDKDIHAAHIRTLGKWFEQGLIKVGE